MRIRLAFAVLCDYGPDNYNELQTWLDQNCRGHHHFSYTTNPAQCLPRVMFQYKQDATNFELWLNSDPWQIPHQQYLKSAIANGTVWCQQQVRDIK